MLVSRWLCTSRSRYGQCVGHTPADDDVPVEVASLGEEGLYQQGEQVEAFNEQPEVVGEHAVMEEYHHRSTFHLNARTHTHRRENTHKQTLHYDTNTSLIGYSQ